MQRYLLLLLGMLALGACHEFTQAVQDAKKEVPPPPKDNYIVLLDLSDRILFNNQQQVPKDIRVIQSLYTAFKARLNAKDPTHLYYRVNDKLKVLVAPQKNTLQDVYNIAGDLRLDLSAIQPDQKAQQVDKTEQQFTTLLTDLYKKAVISNNSTDYAGADIWKYFNEDLQDDLDKEAQNTLFIITDGYMNFESTQGRPSQNHRYTSCTQIIGQLKNNPDWANLFQKEDYGLLPLDKKFPALKVVLLELNPKDDWTGEYSLLTKIWSKWFTEMGITAYTFIKDDNINEVNESLEKVMQVKIPVTSKGIAWTPVATIDSFLASQAKSRAVATAATEKATGKKKELSKAERSPTSSALSKTSKLNRPVKPTIKNKEQVSFGPVY